MIPENADTPNVLFICLDHLRSNWNNRGRHWAGCWV